MNMGAQAKEGCSYPMYIYLELDSGVYQYVTNKFLLTFEYAFVQVSTSDRVLLQYSVDFMNKHKLPICILILECKTSSHYFNYCTCSQENSSIMLLKHVHIRQTNSGPLIANNQETRLVAAIPFLETTPSEAASQSR